MEYRYPIQSGIPGQVPAPMPFPDNNRMHSQEEMRLHEALTNGIGRYVMAHFLPVSYTHLSSICPESYR